MRRVRDVPLVKNSHRLLSPDTWDSQYESRDAPAPSPELPSLPMRSARTPNREEPTLIGAKTCRIRLVSGAGGSRQLGIPPSLLFCSVARPAGGSRCHSGRQQQPPRRPLRFAFVEATASWTRSSCTHHNYFSSGTKRRLPRRQPRVKESPLRPLRRSPHAPRTDGGRTANHVVSKE